MPYRRIALLATLWMTVALGACDGCQSRAKSPDPEPPTAAADAGATAKPVLGHSPIFDERLFLLAGKTDIDNLYSSAVMVASKPDGNAIQRCSGVALSRRLILTAGHCVCARSKPELPGTPTVIDGSQCASRASVETVVYRRVPGLEDDASSETRVYYGRVRPHPALRVVLNEQGMVTSSKADLAVVVLDKPLEGAIRTEALAEPAVQSGEMIVIVGYGYDEIEDVFDEERRFSHNKVVSLDPGGDRGQIEQPGRHPYRGDSGGPCFRQGVAGARLVGISSRWLGKGATFTSTYGYRDWIQAELRFAGEVGDARVHPRP